MGLGYGSKPIKSKNTTTNCQDQEQLIEEDEEGNSDEILDADHVTMQIDPSHQELDVEVNNLKNISKKTTLRFHLKKRSKTVQGLLEKMFENELKEEDQNGF